MCQLEEEIKYLKQKLHIQDMLRDKSPLIPKNSGKVVSIFTHLRNMIILVLKNKM